MTVTLIRSNGYTKGWIGTSTDTKPLSAEEIGLGGASNGDTFYQVDDGKKYMYHEGTWYEIGKGIMP